MKKKWFIGFILSAALIFALAACSGDDKDANGDDNGDSGDSGDSSRLAELQEKGTIVVGFADEKPYAYEEDGELKGVAVDVATEVLKMMGIENVEGQLADFGQLIPGLKAKKFDIITASMAITGDRCENVAFGEPEVLYGEGLIVQAGNPLNLHSYEDIADNPDATVSIMSGATENDFVVEKGVDEGQIQSAPDIPATLSAVESGRADATTGTEMTIKMAYESADSDNLEFVEDFEQPIIIPDGGEAGSPSYGAAAFRLDDDALREAYNEKLAELKETDKYGELLEANFFSAEANAVGNDVTTEMVCSGDIYKK
jgi:polar amino acid transport system substrate-binding protein